MIRLMLAMEEDLEDEDVDQDLAVEKALVMAMDQSLVTTVEL